MKKAVFYIVLAFCILQSQTAFAQKVDLSMPLNPETFKIWDDFIKSNAPSRDALDVVITMSQRHQFAGRAGVSYMIYGMYEALFPAYKQAIDEERERLVEIMLTQTPHDDMGYIYVNYIQSHPNTEKAFVAMQRLTDKFVDSLAWDSVAYVYNHFLPMFPSYQKRINKILNIIKAPAENLKISNLGPNINSPNDEWDPTPSADGKYLYFSASGLYPNYGRSDIYFSGRDSTNNWGKFQNLGRQINGENDETIDNISLDGNTLVMSGNFGGTFGEFDIYTASRTENGWTRVQHLPSPINSKYFDEGANITPDGKAIIFTSDRPGGIGEYVGYNTIFHGNAMGNMDLYVSLATDSGWSQPINLGETINTPFAERAPYLHPDGKTLYFSSDGHPGLGRLDVFKSVRLSDTSWTQWSEPVNLGKEINTSTDDWGYIVNLKGDTAYFSALNRANGYGGWDIYSVTLPEFAKAERTITIQGKVYDKDKNIIAATIKWEDLETGREIGIAHSNPQTGEYIIVLPFGKKYGYFAEADGYFPNSSSIDLKKKRNDDNYQNNIVLAKVDNLLQAKENITINNIFFDYDKYEIKPESYPELNRLEHFLKKYPNQKITIQGHTDNVGSKQYNIQLSLKRAKAVAEYLISKGLNRNNIKTEGFGYSKPISTNPEDADKNRRVEVTFK